MTPSSEAEIIIAPSPSTAAGKSLAGLLALTWHVLRCSPGSQPPLPLPPLPPTLTSTHLEGEARGYAGDKAAGPGSFPSSAPLKNFKGCTVFVCVPCSVLLARAVTRLGPSSPVTESVQFPERHLGTQPGAGHTPGLAHLVSPPHTCSFPCHPGAPGAELSLSGSHTLTCAPPKCPRPLASGLLGQESDTE